MRITNRERRDWTLIIFIIPIGIILMMIAGQIAVRIVPQWSVNGGMKSQLDPQTAPKQQVGFVQPVLSEILTPLGWFDTFLTPNSNSGNQDIVFPPFIVFEPTATPSPTNPPVVSPTVTATLSTPVSPSPSPTTVTEVPYATKTKKPPEEDVTPVPPTQTATPVTPTAPPITSTIDPTVLTEVPTPVGLNIGTPDGSIGLVLPGNYAVINLGGSGVRVNGTQDTNYDLVYYEFDSGGVGSGVVRLDHVIIGISQSDLSLSGSVYYEVFNWGNNIPDTNTNADTNTLPADPICDPTASAPECDNRVIPAAELYPSPPAPPPNTGILIDVDNAPSAPPPGDYRYVVFISPLSGAPDEAQVDAIQVTEVPP